MLQKGYSFNEFPNKGLMFSIRNRMQCRGTLVRWEGRKSFPSGEGQVRQRAKADMYWFLVLLLGLHSPVNCSGPDSKEEALREK